MRSIAITVLACCMVTGLTAAEGPALQVVINEIAWMGTSEDFIHEWIELFNNTSSEIDLEGWTLNAADGSPQIVLSGFIPAGNPHEDLCGYFLLKRSSDFPEIPDADQTYTGALENVGEILELRDATDVLQDQVNAEGGWHAGDNDTKETMQRIDPTAPGTPENWMTAEGTPTNSRPNCLCPDPNYECPALELHECFPSDPYECPAPQRVVDCQLGEPFEFRTGGSVVINEVMINPEAVPDFDGEYVELYNSSLKDTIDIEGWTLRDDGSNSFTITTGQPVNLVPGAFFVIAAEDDPELNGGFTADYEWSNFGLSQSGDEVILLDDTDVEQDRLEYTGKPFTNTSGRSIERVSPRLPTSDPLSWKPALNPFGLGDRGTPGGVNTLQARRYLLTGTLVTMDETRQVFPGTLYIQGNRIMDVLQEGDPLPPDADGALSVATGGLIFPGLMNIHDHIMFNTLPAWDLPDLMHDVEDWTKLSEYQEFVRHPHTILTDFYKLKPEVGKYAEVKALAAGTTSVQGSFPQSPGFTRHLARNVDFGGFGADKIRQRALSILGYFPSWDPCGLFDDMDAGEVDAWLVHLAEGTAEDAECEFARLRLLCLVRSETVIIHGTALTPAHLDEMAAAGMKLIIAPTSNYLYYGATADVIGAVERGITVSLSTDWSPAGDKNLLASLKSISLINDTIWDAALTDLEIVEMVITSPAKTLNWCQYLGSLRPGLFADLAMISGDPAEPYRALIEATEEDVLLTIVDGEPLYGRPAFMNRLKPGDFEIVVSGCGFEAALDIDTIDPDIPRGVQLFSEASDLLSTAMEYDPQHMFDAFGDLGCPDDLPEPGCDDRDEFLIWLGDKFPEIDDFFEFSLDLDPYSVIEDADYIEGLRRSNVTCLDPNATLDIEFQWDVDGDGVYNACDVGLDDFRIMLDCFSGPGRTPDPTPPMTSDDCLNTSDFDGDLDVDFHDFAFLQLAFSVPLP